MNWKYFLFGVGAGAAAAFAVKESMKHHPVSPDQVLENTKNAFKQHGPISGSWINMETETYSKPPIVYTVYKGGVTRKRDGMNEQFEFIADALTGTILEVRPL